MTTDDDPAPVASPAVRASDAERERTATLLREHCAAGRLTPEELSERLDSAFAARTVAELAALTRDLPELDEPPRHAGGHTRSPARERVLHAAGFLALVNATCIAIWIATGADAPFWPQWVLLGTAIRFAFRAWAELGPGAGTDEARLGRGGSGPRPPRPPRPPQLPGPPG